MSRHRISRIAGTLACLVACALFVGVFAQATGSPESALGQGLGFDYDSVREVTLVGNVRRPCLSCLSRRRSRKNAVLGCSLRKEGHRL
jgi:hypothetical protein